MRAFRAWLRAAAAGAMTVAATCAHGGEGRWWLEGGGSFQRLDEYTARGDRNVREEGIVPRLAFGLDEALGPLDGWVAGEWRGGLVDYDGHTQGGSAARSDTRTSGVAVDLGVRHAVRPRWTLGAGLLFDRMRRDIHGVPGASGLDERVDSRSLFAELRHLQPFGREGELRLRAGFAPSGRMRVDFKGLFDPANFDTGSRRFVELSARFAPWGAARPSLRASLLAWQLDRSAPAVLALSGRAVGTVTQPEFRGIAANLGVQWRF